MTGPAVPNGTERPGEHWNARLVREATDRAVHAMATASTTVDTHADATTTGYVVLKPDLVAVLLDVADEQVYRRNGLPHRWRARLGEDAHCWTEIQYLVALGLVSEPPEGGSFYQLTDAAEPFVRAARSLAPGMGAVVRPEAASTMDGSRETTERPVFHSEAASLVNNRAVAWSRGSGKLGLKRITITWDRLLPPPYLRTASEFYQADKVDELLDQLTAERAEWRRKYNRQCLHALTLITKLGPVAEGAQALIDEAAGQSLRDEPPAPKMATDERSDVAIAALATLVHLKDGPRDDDYRHRIDAAWDLARWVVLGFGGQAAPDDH